MRNIYNKHHLHCLPGMVDFRLPVKERKNNTKFWNFKILVSIVTYTHLPFPSKRFYFILFFLFLFLTMLSFVFQFH
uniref:Copper-transporting atpase p-type n=1 Tax=Rhizophora mucronata TaxID=61149 RepID=A0A2P2PIB5_RHIMU